jgi:uncharacterized protein (DUF1697 family)
MTAQVYVALLRGINVGGNKPVKMDALRKAFASLGHGDVRTLLASGNVLFHAPKTNEGLLTQSIKKMLAAKFGNSGVILRTREDLQKITRINPFREIRVTPEVRLYVTFLSFKPATKLKTPHQSPARDFQILKVSGREVFSILTLTDRTQSTDLMMFIEKEFGREVTTRNWNTVLKIASAAG